MFCVTSLSIYRLAVDLLEHSVAFDVRETEFIAISPCAQLISPESELISVKYNADN